MVEYLTKWIYGEDKASIEQQFKQYEVNLNLIDNIILKPYFKKDGSIRIKERDEKIKEINRLLKEKTNIDVERAVKMYRQLFANLFETQNAQFIIEEPEQNLFPRTQRDLVYYLLKECFNKEGNRVTITTHSPYILYALNNCMMGYLVKGKMLQTEEDKQEYADLKSLTSAIDPNTVSVWQIKEDGTIENIQGEDNLIEDNYFDGCMKEVMDDYYKMINYYGDEDED
jgi:hypothetical protein